MVRLFRFPIVALGILAPSQALLAQNVRQEIRNLFQFGDCTGIQASLICLNTLTGHGSHFIQSAEEVAGTVTAFLGSAITTSVSNIPLGSTSSGMTFAFDPTGRPVATSQSTGPIFGERSQTLGRRRALVGISATGNSFKSIRGESLSDLRTTLTHEDVSPNGLGQPGFERDSIVVRTDLSSSAQVFTAFVGYGLNNRLDVGLAVPLVRVSVEGLSVGTIYNRPGTATHLWAGGIGTTVDTARASSSATGIGDISVRAKFNLTQSQGGGTGLMVDLRVPTGREEDLLGSGNAALRGIFIASARFNQFAPHLNVGYLYRAGESENSAILGTFGFDALLAPALTAAADILGQWQTGESKILLPAPVTFIDGSVAQRTNIPDARDNLVAASIGAKLTIGQEMTGVANLLFPVANGGVKSSVVWTVGLERTF